MNDTDNIGAAAVRLAAATEALEQTIARISASHESLHSKVDRIIAAVDERTLAASAERTDDLERRIATLERENAELKATAEHIHSQDGVGGATAGTRKTLAPFVSMLLTKSGVDDVAVNTDSAVLDKALASLSVEQRVAVKTEMARAGIIS
jgi:transposase